MEKFLVHTIGKFYNAVSYISKTYAANKAIGLFTKPRKGRITEEQNEFLGTAFQEELQFENKPIMTYRWLGKKETILLGHGWESNSARWRSLILKLKSNDYNIIALDAPAHGYSKSNSFNAVLYSEYINVVAQRFQPDIVVGHSVGGMAAVFCQNKYRLKSIQKLILLGVPSEFKNVLKRYTDMLGYNQRIINELNSIIIERFGNEPNSFSTAKYLETIHSKGLIIHDEDDDVIPYNDAIQINQSFKNSKLITTKGLGHSLNNETVAGYISDFIEA
ncbi:pimeloyl-ACP methyl ester carboxylesterase [Flavobacteriaceae bacterium MAR_2010_72]|nr:pimeloyl-ACP methyl ester carboxylesterase [Flavobacteriaceae bacterium MAR_2010_72]TVZ57585.1 pimeloyl-ACP methyl ester carboxylesterase [Flavobacteriaceae bacterium MAR_2010_105]